MTVWAPYDYWAVPLVLVAWVGFWLFVTLAVWRFRIALRKHFRAIRVANVRDRSADLDWEMYRAFYARRAMEIALARHDAISSVTFGNTGHSVRVAATTLEVVR